MPTKLLSILLLLLLATFISCDQSEDVLAPKIPKIKTISRTSSGTTTVHIYTYDALGRLTSIKGNYHFSLHYSYQKDRIIKIDSLQQQSDTLLLNEEGLVISVLNKYISNEYDPEGYFVRFIWSSPSGVIGPVYEYKISDGNTIQSEIRAFQKLSYTSDYTHLPNSINTIGNENMGITFYGKQDKNLVSRCIVTTHSTGDWVVVTYRYEMDAQNRVIKRWTDSKTSNIYEEFTYY